ncbi:NAD(P)-binding domain-containing protein [Demequina sp.]|uniref:NAD(P)-binding domain-containing protein n=1 Tax=Demequina sp. TaxID=2050685 RepID=UPI003A86F36C
MRSATVAVIGAGQAGLSAAHHLRRRGFGSALEHAEQGASFVVFDANARPGGAWQHRWPSLTMSTVNGIFGLPGMDVPTAHPHAPSREAVPDYFADYEADQNLPILRPVRVTGVRAATNRPGGPLEIDTDHDQWSVDAIINATGTWDNPVLPTVAGQEVFAGRQLHASEFTQGSDFAGQHVAIVGGGISAVQLLEEVSRYATTHWYTRREPQWRDGDFVHEIDGVDVERRVAADTAQGLAPKSIVSYTGLARTAYAREAERRGVLHRKEMFRGVGVDHVKEADGRERHVDTIIWATGFRPALQHLRALGLEGPLGGVPVDGTRALADSRVHLIGYGPSQSTIGANRAGRAAAAALARRFVS